MLQKEPVELPQLLRAEHPLDLQSGGQGPSLGQRGGLPDGKQVQPDRRCLRGPLPGESAQEDGSWTIQLISPHVCLLISHKCSIIYITLEDHSGWRPVDATAKKTSLSVDALGGQEDEQ